MRYVISDIHGEYGLFMRLMDDIALSAGDVLYVCGDIIDKGSQSVRLLRQIFSMSNVRCILGNHEHAFLKYYWSLMRSSPENFNEVLSKLRAYFPSPDELLLGWEDIDALEGMPYFIEEDDFICVHAGLPLEDDGRIASPAAVKPEFLVNDRTFKSPQVVPVHSKCVFFGHTPARYICDRDCILAYRRDGSAGGKIGDYYKVHLDTGVYMGGVLGCFCIDTCLAHYVKSPLCK